MKIFNYGLICFMLSFSGISHAEMLTATLSQDNIKLVKLLKKGDTLKVNYDLKRSPIFRYHEWAYYALFCYTHGMATIDYFNNGENKTNKLPMLASKEEYSQAGVDLTSIDAKGSFVINNTSPYDAGTIVACELYSKFGP